MQFQQSSGCSLGGLTNCVGGKFSIRCILGAEGSVGRRVHLPGTEDGIGNRGCFVRIEGGVGNRVCFVKIKGGVGSRRCFL